MTSCPRVLYIASAGIGDPLIESQVIRYLRRLCHVVETCHLITFERQVISESESESIRRALSEDGIQWHPIRVRSGSRLLNVPREIFGGYRLATRLIREHDLNLIHARSFVPGNIGLRAARKTGVKLLYDMRGFWAEEKAAKGTIRQPSIRKAAERMENRLFAQSDALVSLTHVGKACLEEKGVTTPIDVIPCCVDTDVFQWDGRARNSIDRLVSVGSLGPGYLPEAVFGVYAAARRRHPNVRLTLVTRTPRDAVRRSATAAGCDAEPIEVIASEPCRVPELLRPNDVGLCMIRPSVAKKASSPTRLAEYFACGLPVIANCEGIGDMRDIVLGRGVGANLESFDPDGCLSAVDRLGELLTDPSLSSRCRQLAETSFSVNRGAESYAAIYLRLLDSTR